MRVVPIVFGGKIVSIFVLPIVSVSRARHVVCGLSLDVMNIILICGHV